jgi:two-component system LytT family sensor kinase
VIAPNAAEVLNLVGFVTGTALYAMLLTLVLRGSPGSAVHGNPDGLPSQYLPLATGVLGLVWNLGELSAYALPRLGYFTESIGLWAMSFPALGLLAAVVVHSVARALPRGMVLTVIAYGCSIAASVLHLKTVITGDPEPSSLAFLILTVSYGLIILALGVLTRTQANGQRVLWILALALFAVSASHLGRFHAAGDGWAVELIGHHAAIPLAFAILYQDYRFALADLFLKRALTLIALVAIAFAGYSAATMLPAGPLAAGALMALWVGTSLVSPWLHRRIVRFVDQSLLGRMDYAALGAGIGQALQSRNSIAGVLDVVAERLAPALDARRVWWQEEGVAAGAGTPTTTQALVPATDLPRFVVTVGELTGGRRLLSDDLALVETVVATAARRIDQIRLTHERFEVQLREEEMQKLTAEAELKALRAQVNPHFLFNALTTIGYLIETAPPRAMNTLMQLTALLRGVLRSEGDFTTLGREIELVEHYLQIEHERFEERLRVRIDVPPALRVLRIPALVIQPLVENAIKHGVAPSTTGGDVDVTARIDASGGSERLRIAVRNTGAPLKVMDDRVDLSTVALAKVGQVGVDNVRRRLAGYYGEGASLTLTAEPGRGTVAELVLPLAEAAGIDKDDLDAQAVAGRAGRR